MFNVYTYDKLKQEELKRIEEEQLAPNIKKKEYYKREKLCKNYLESAKKFMLKVNF